MKKISVGALLLVLAGIGYLTSCALQQNPLSPVTPLTGTENANAVKMPTVTSFTGPAATTDPVEITFSMAMNASTFTTATVQVWYKTDDYNEAQYTEFSLSYNAALKRLTISPTGTNNEWVTDRRYRVELSTGIQSLTGDQLDGNGNAIAEDNAFDKYNNQFSLGSPTTSVYTFAALSVLSAQVEWNGGSGSIATGNLGGVAAAYSYVTITVQFSDDVNQSTVFVDHTTLHSNLGFVNDATQDAVGPVDVSMTAENIIRAVFQLSPNTRYKLTLQGGVSGIRSSDESTSHNLLRNRYFDGDGDSRAEAADKAERYIMTLDSNNTTASTSPPTAFASYSSANRCWTITFTVPSPSNAMDTTTLTTSNIQMIATYDTSYNVQAKAMVLASNGTIVYLYVPDSFYPGKSGYGPNVNMVIKISRYVKSADGVYLDGDGDGVGGTEDDDYVSFTYSVDSSL